MSKYRFFFPPPEEDLPCEIAAVDGFDEEECDNLGTWLAQDEDRNETQVCADHMDAMKVRGLA